MQTDDQQFQKIIAYVTGTMSSFEKAQFESEITPEIISEIEKMELVLQLTNEYIIDNNIHTNEAWKKLNAKIEENKTPKIRQILKQNWLKIAASLLFFIVSSSLFFLVFNNKNNNTYLKNTQILPSQYQLPDGTQLVMDSGATIEFKDNFNKHMREVSITGRIFFNVTENKQKPFVITSKNALITVMGTSFTVDETSEAICEVLVESGRVKLQPKNNPDKKIILIKGENGTLQNNFLSVKIISDKNYMAWKTREIIFNNDSLKNVINTLSNIYHTPINYNKDIDTLKITATFNNQELPEILDLIAATFYLKVTKSENYYTIDK